MSSDTAAPLNSAILAAIGILDIIWSHCGPPVSVRQSWWDFDHKFNGDAQIELEKDNYDHFIQLERLLRVGVTR